MIRTISVYQLSSIIIEQLSRNLCRICSTVNLVRVNNLSLVFDYPVIIRSVCIVYKHCKYYYMCYVILIISCIEFYGLCIMVDDYY